MKRIYLRHYFSSTYSDWSSKKYHYAMLDVYELPPSYEEFFQESMLEHKCQQDDKIKKGTELPADDPLIDTKKARAQFTKDFQNKRFVWRKAQLDKLKAKSQNASNPLRAYHECWYKVMVLF